MSLYSLLTVFVLFGSLTSATPIPSDDDGSSVAAATTTNEPGTSASTTPSSPTPTTTSGVENTARPGAATFGNLRLQYSTFETGRLLDGHLDEWTAASKSDNPPFTQERIDDFAWEMNTAIETQENAFWYFPSGNDQDKNYTISFGLVHLGDSDANPLNQNDVNNAVYRIVSDVLQYAPVACGFIWDPTTCENDNNPEKCPKSIAIQVGASPNRQMALDFTCTGVTVDHSAGQQWHTIE